MTTERRVLSDSPPDLGRATRIRVLENGPLQVKGDFEMSDAYGTAYQTRNTVLLCRCGKSATKPFCDGAHARIGFHASERAGQDS